MFRFSEVELPLSKEFVERSGFSPSHFQIKFVGDYTVYGYQQRGRAFPDRTSCERSQPPGRAHPSPLDITFQEW